jgi:hypothetical protein
LLTCGQEAEKVYGALELKTRWKKFSETIFAGKINY